MQNSEKDTQIKLSAVSTEETQRYNEIASKYKKGDIISAEDEKILSDLVERKAKENGYSEKMYHGSKKSEDIKQFYDWQYFTQNEKYAKRYAGKKLYSVFVKADNWFDTRKAEARELFNKAKQEYGMSDLQNDGLPDWTDGYDISEYIDENDLPYDGIILNEGGDMVNGEPVSRGKSYVIRKSAQIKSAEPITYDDNGNPIPIEKRFDEGKSDIRFSASKKSQNNIANVQSKGYNDSEQYGTMWTLEDNVLDKREVAAFYSKISELNNNSYKTFITTKEGQYLFEIGKKIVFTDGDYDYPQIEKVVNIDIDNSELLNYGRDEIYNAVQQGTQVEDVIEVVKAVLGEENVKITTFGDYETSKGSNTSEERAENDRTNSRTPNNRSGEDVKFSATPKKSYAEQFETQDLIRMIADDIGYHEGLIEASKKNKEEFVALAKSNESLTKRLESAKAEMKRTKVPKTNNYSVLKHAKSIIDYMGSKASSTEIGEKAAAIYNQYYKEMKESGGVQGLQERALANMAGQFQDLAVEILNQAEEYPDGDDYIQLRAYLKNQAIKFPDYLKSDVEYKEFRKAHFGTIKLANNGLAIDSVYQELSTMFPHLFNQSKYTNPADQLQHIADVLDSLKPKPYNPYEMYMDEAVEEVVNQFVAGVDTVMQGPTKADKLAMEANEALEKQRAEFEKKYQELKAETKKRLQNQNRSRNERARKANLKVSIRKTFNDLNARLTHPTDSKKVPVGLMKSIAEVCKAVDFSTDRTGADGQPTKARLYLDSLKRRYDDIQNDKDYDIASEFDETLSGKLNELCEVVGDKRVMDLNTDELAALDDILKQIKHQVINANKQLAIDEALTNREIGQEIYENLNSGKTKRTVLKGALMHAMNPERCFRMFSNYDENSKLYKLFKQLNDGYRKSDNIRMRLTKPFQELISGKGNVRLYNEFTTKYIDTELKDIDGNKVRLTRSMIAQIVMTWDRQQGRTHLENGGITVPGEKEYLKGDMTKAFNETQRRVEKITQGDINKLKSLLDSYDAEWMDRAKLMFNGESQNALNETSLILKGRKLAQAKNYIPIKTDKNFVASDIDALKYDATIEGAGTLKSVNPQAKQSILIEGLHSTVEKHVDFVAKYAGLAIPIRNFKKVWNVTFAGDNARNSLKEVFGKKWGTYAKNTIVEQLLTDLQTTRGSSTEGKIMGKIMSNWTAATLNFNLSVAMKQAASYPTAGYVLGHKALVKGLSKAFSLQNTIDEIDKYTGIHYKRRLGQSTQELGDLATHKPKLAKAFDVLPDGVNPLKWIQNVDVYTTALLWEASKYHVNDNYKHLEKGSDEYWAKVTEVYEKTIEQTQPNYDMIHRPEIQKTTNNLLKAMVMFQTQPLQNSGIIYDSFLNLQEKAKSGDKNDLKNAKNEFARAVSSQIVSALVFATMTLAGRTLLHKFKKYNDDRGEMTKESTIKAVMGDVAQTAFSVVAPVFGNPLCEFVNKIVADGYDYEIPIMSLVNGLSDSLKNLYATCEKIDGIYAKKSVSEKANLVGKDVVGILKKMSPVFGIPLENEENLRQGIAQWIQDATNGKQDENYDADGNYVVEWKSIYSYQDIAGAILSGNSKREEKIRKYYEDNFEDINEKIDIANSKKSDDEDKQDHKAFNKGSLTRYIKPVYIDIYDDEPEECERIKNLLVEYYGYDEDAIDKWVKEK